MSRRIGRIRPAGLVAMLVALLCALVCCTATATSAGAAPHAAPYSTSPTISLSQTNPCELATLTLDGQNFTPGTTVTVSIGSHVFGTAVAGSDGVVRYTFTLPPRLAGTVTVTAAGGSAVDTATTELDINGDCAAGVSAGPSGSTGTATHSHHGSGSAGSGSGSTTASGGGASLSYTGVAIYGMLVVAFVLLGGGVLLVLGGRRRRVAA